MVKKMRVEGDGRLRRAVSVGQPTMILVVLALGAAEYTKDAPHTALISRHAVRPCLQACLRLRGGLGAGGGGTPWDEDTEEEDEEEMDNAQKRSPWEDSVPSRKRMRLPRPALETETDVAGARRDDGGGGFQPGSESDPGDGSSTTQTETDSQEAVNALIERKTATPAGRATGILRQTVATGGGRRPLDRQAVMAGLKEGFGLDGFRPGQEQTISRVLSGNNTLFISATGSGKSLTYLLPTFLWKRHGRQGSGLTLVISPLLALIRDQLQQLPQGLRGACLTGDMTPAEQRQVIRLKQPPKP